jgi:hypothetical protein
MNVTRAPETQALNHTAPKLMTTIMRMNIIRAKIPDTICGVIANKP